MKNLLQAKTGIVLILFLLGTPHISAQLQLNPPQIEFPDDFHRLQNVYFINTGVDTIKVDSIYYNSTINYNANLYITRFNKGGEFPFSIAPGDSVLMDCILAGYFAVTQQDKDDTMWVAIRSRPPENLKIKIYKYLDKYQPGKITGIVLDGGVPVDNANVSIFYGGNFLYRKVKTQNNGSYSVTLPAGIYTVSVDKPGYFTAFYNQQFDPLSSSIIILHAYDSLNINLDINQINPTDSTINITGRIIDYLSKAAIRSGVVVIRRGSHTPSKSFGRLPADIYAGLINSDGTFKIEDVNPGSYYIQSFSSYYSPSYYSSTNPFENFWYQTGTVSITQSKNNIDIEMQRDSSFWGGKIDGSITADSSLFQFSDIIVYAYSVNIFQDTLIYSYAVANDSGKFSINGLPNGTYNLVAQKIGYKNAHSPDSYTISETNTIIQNVIISYSESTSDESLVIPNTTRLYQNYPNPFNPTTNIKFYLNAGSNITLKVINILGQEVAALMDGFFTSGFHTLNFNANNLSSGTYFIYLVSNDGIQVKKMILIK